MRKLLLLSAACLMLGACGGFYSKQPVDDTYYKKTQGVSWPDESSKTTSTKGKPQKAVPAKTSGKVAEKSSDATGLTPLVAYDSSIPSAPPKQPEEKWQDAKPAPEKVAVPAAVEKKLQCVQKGDTYTCRWGGRICGYGCKSDGSNCSAGYCLQSDCDDVMGQKWEWIERSSGVTRGDYYGYMLRACKHPDYPVVCSPQGGIGIACEVEAKYGYDTCGWHCNKNGTECGNGDNNCWDKYR